VIRVLLVDADDDRRAALADALGGVDGIEVVGQAADGRMACSAVVAVNPDVVVLDASLPVLSGPDLTAWLSEACPWIRVVGLAPPRREAGAEALRSSGAVAVLDRGTPIDEISAAIFGAVAAA
jgi:DNA-binding NarL/FixJ family response regulator